MALIYDSPVTDTIQSFTFRELREQVAKCAGALAELGLSTIVQQTSDGTSRGEILKKAA